MKKLQFKDLDLVLDFIKNQATNDTMNMMIYAIKDKRKALAKQVRGTLSIGDKVIVNARFGTENGTITKVMKTRCAVKFDSNGLVYACPMGIITFIKDREVA